MGASAGVLCVSPANYFVLYRALACGDYHVFCVEGFSSPPSRTVKPLVRVVRIL
nr:MAG TPA: hypothetical protein [Caudoviricetes sp.]